VVSQSRRQRRAKQSHRSSRKLCPVLGL